MFCIDDNADNIEDNGDVAVCFALTTTLIILWIMMVLMCVLH